MMVCLNVAHRKYLMPLSIFLRQISNRDANRRHAVIIFPNALSRVTKIKRPYHMSYPLPLLLRRVQRIGDQGTFEGNRTILLQCRNCFILRSISIEKMNEYVLILCLSLTVVAVTKVYTGINHIYTLAVTFGCARGKIKFSLFCNL